MDSGLLACAAGAETQLSDPIRDWRLGHGAVRMHRHRERANSP
jgi:hypothetical protein